MDAKDSPEGTRGTTWAEQLTELVEHPPLATDTRISHDRNAVVAFPSSHTQGNGFRRRPYKSSSLHLFVAAMVDFVCDSVQDGNRMRAVLSQMLVRSGWVPAIYLSESYLSLRNSIKNMLQSCIPIISDVSPAVTRSLIGREMRFSPFASSRYMSDFEELELIGKGGFGKVFVAQSRIDNCKYAIKKISFTFRRSEPMIKAISEVRMLASLKHKNIVRYYSAWAELNFEKEERPSQLRIREMRSSESIDDKNVEHAESDDVVISGHENSWKLSSVKKKSSTKKGRFWGMDETDSSSTTDLDDGNNNVASSDSLPLPSVSEATGSSATEEISSSAYSACVPYQKKSTSELTATMYVQMELCTQTLDDYLKKRNEAVTVRICRRFNENIIKQLAAALSYIHMKNIIHRDVKPCNLFLCDRGSALPKLLLGDFGLACREDGGPVASKSDFLSSSFEETFHSAGVGTAIYAAPEQASREYDTSVDIYSAGIVAFELYSPSATTMERHLKIDLLRKGELDPKFCLEFPDEAKLIAAMCHREPSKRPRAFEVTSRLEQIEKRSLDMLLQEIAKKDEIIRGLDEQIRRQKEEIESLKEELRSKSRSFVN